METQKIGMLMLAVPAFIFFCWYLYWAYNLLVSLGGRKSAHQSLAGLAFALSWIAVAAYLAVK